MKGKVKFLVPIILAIVVMAVTLGVYLFPRVEEIVDSAKAGETMLADKTGNTSEFGLAGPSNKIGKFWTYSKDGEFDLNVFCAQEGASASTWKKYKYDEVEWNRDSEVWKDIVSYKKITWILDNFWESMDSRTDKYTTNEKVAILKNVDSSITASEVESVFDNDSEKFKLYQMIAWKYTNGRNVNPSNYISGNTMKMYNAIIGLADKYYDEVEELKITAGDSATWDSSNNTYVWNVKVDNTFLLPYENANNGNSSLRLVVDGNNYINYTYDGSKLVISGVDDGEHTFTVSAYTYRLSTIGSVWLNGKHQNFIEITDSTKNKVSDSASVTTAPSIKPGKFNLQILKVDEKTNAGVKDAQFTINNNSYTTDDNGVAKIVNGDAVTEKGIVYNYTITEASTSEKYIKLKNAIDIVLKSGEETTSNGTYYAITSAIFKKNGSDTIKVETVNGDFVVLKLNIEQNNDTTTVKLTVPNKEKVYDLALTKTIVTGKDELLDQYDINRDGIVNVTDATIWLELSNKWLDWKTNNESAEEEIKGFLEASVGEAYESYYKYFSGSELVKMLVPDENALVLKGQQTLQSFAEQLAGNDVDRIKNIIYKTVLNKDGNTTAKYMLNKSPYEVEVSDEIIYKITVYNEGDYASKDIVVTDYLPEGLVICDVVSDGDKKTSTVSYGDKQYVWTVDEANNLAYIKIDNTINAYNGNYLDHQNVYIKCKINKDLLDNGTINYDDILYNAAEITSSQPVDSQGQNAVGLTDRDSIENSIDADTNNNIIQKYTEKFEAVENAGNYSGNINKALYNYQDDDDFERIIIKKSKKGLDLSLRKSISKVGASEEKMTNVTSDYTYDSNKQVGDRLPVIPEEASDACVSTGTGLYFHPKKAVLVNTGDFVEYTIRVFNEGGRNDYAGYASQITDYLPEGLEFYAVVNNDGSWVTEHDANNVYKTAIINNYGGYEVKYDAENNKVVMDYKGSLPLRIQNSLYKVYQAMMDGEETFGYYNPQQPESDEYNNQRYIYQEVKIICKVTTETDSKKLTNVAEITGYVASELDGTPIQGVTDRDSSPNISISDSTDMKNNKINLDTYYDDRNIDDVYNQYYPGCEDDDDFETVVVKVINGSYNLVIRKVNSTNNEPIDGATFKVNGVTTKPTVNGVTTVIEKPYNTTNINEVDEYKITEISIDSDIDYVKLKDPVVVYVKKSLEKIQQNGEEVEVCKVSEVSFEKSAVRTSMNVKLEDGTVVKIALNTDGRIVEVVVPNKPTGFDLSLRKFISSVNGNKLEGKESREPVVDTSKLVSGESTTAEYKHTKEPKLVSPKDVVEYTLRIYNEGKLDGYATLIMDDVPEGVEMIAPAYDENGKAGNLNAQYRWVMYKKYVVNDETNESKDASSSQVSDSTQPSGNVQDETTMIRYNNTTYVKTTKPEEAELIVTDYLSKSNGEAMMAESGAQVNPNLLKAFNYEKGLFTEENYRDIKVEFKVKATNEEDKIITNYAQITEDADSTGGPVTDRDSTPNEWIEEEDDQDIERIKVRHFDLALYKWVSKAIVTEDGKTTEYPSNHTQDDKSKMVNVSIPKDKLNKVTVKFKYQIKVENQGLLEGYAKEVKDHIPEGLKFVAEDNKEYGWVLNEDGTITTDYLKDTLLKTGETAEVTVVLTWINNANNLGQKINYAEISKDYNWYGAPDKDSTPDNFTGKCVEDDEDSDVVMLQVRTGMSNVSYIVLATSVMAIVAAGVVGIKKFVI